MTRGLLPGAIVGVLLVVALSLFAASLPGLVEWATPFADTWPAFWAGAIRIGIGLASLVAAVIVAVVSFTALSLALGEPFYDRIWRSVESAQPGGVPAGSTGFWSSIGDAASLFARGLGVAVLAAIVGLVPVIGSALGAVTGIVLTGWVLADELSARSLGAHGLDRTARRRLLRSRRARALGFGVATQLCFAVPFGAVAVMPAAVAGSTLLARSLLGETDAAGSGTGARQK